MLDLESVTAEMAGDKVFATVDLCHGFWHMKLDESAQECLSFITPDGLFSPTRVPQGQTNAAQFFQSSLQLLFRNLRDVIIQWIDDILFHCKDVSELLKALRSLF